MEFYYLAGQGEPDLGVLHGECVGDDSFRSSNVFMDLTGRVDCSVPSILRIMDLFCSKINIDKCLAS